MTQAEQIAVAQTIGESSYRGEAFGAILVEDGLAEADEIHRHVPGDPGRAPVGKAEGQPDLTRGMARQRDDFRLPHHGKPRVADGYTRV
ncbi:hypothetical protein [Jannaschia aquimarina]|uniref:hypothetical protein n=1 Tax=Jannaschia aquimarina TaxID=935700 RepID=UPI0005C52F10|nr:hypothetical protein [Jannaschia aquimarina]